MLPDKSNPVETRSNPLPVGLPQGETSDFLLAQPDTGTLSHKGKRKALIFFAIDVAALAVVAWTDNPT